jgi:hypothetical protein
VEVVGNTFKISKLVEVKMDPVIRDMSKVHPTLKDRLPAFLRTLNAEMPEGYVVEIFETYRTPQRYRQCINAGTSKVKNPWNGPHSIKKDGFVHAVDCVPKYKGVWTWATFKTKLGRTVWEAMNVIAKQYGFKRVWFKTKYGKVVDGPHLEV